MRLTSFTDYGLRMSMRDEIRLGAAIRSLEADQPLVEGLGPEGGSCVIDGRWQNNARLRSAEAAFLADIAPLPPPVRQAAPRLR